MNDNNLNETLMKLILQSSDEHPIKIAYKKRHRYYDDFVKTMRYFNMNLSKKEFFNLLNKLQIGKKYEKKQFLQAVSEINVLAFILKNYNYGFKYEPKYNGGYNPECAFQINGKTVNVEVKCPVLQKWEKVEKNNKINVYFEERINEYNYVKENTVKLLSEIAPFLGYCGVEEIPRFDNKLKDYLLSAHKKFPKSDDTNFNILVISLEILSDMDKWYGYIWGNKGALTPKSYITDDYENVDAILLTNIVSSHTGCFCYDLNAWELLCSVNLLIPNLYIEQTETGRFFDNYAIDMFGPATRHFFHYLDSLDSHHTDDILAFRNSEIQVITDFVEHWKRIDETTNFLNNN